MTVVSARQDFGKRQQLYAEVIRVVRVLMFVVVAAPCAIADDGRRAPVEQVLEQAKAAWESGAVASALELLEQGIHDYPQALALHQLRGDMLSTFRDPKEAIHAYDQVLAADPAALDVRWAKWAVLVRLGQEAEAIAELRSIAQVDAKNPLAHWRLAQELRKIDRLEESLESYKQAVELKPDAALTAAWSLPEYETHLDHAGLIRGWNAESLKRGEAI